MTTVGCQCLEGWTGKNCDIRGQWNPPETCRDSRFDLSVHDQSNYDLVQAYGPALVIGNGVQVATGESMGKVASKLVLHFNLVVN